MLTYIRTKYIVQKNSIQLKSNQLQRIFFPFFKTTIVAKKKINLNIAYIKELQKYKGLGNTTNNWFTYYSGCLQNTINGIIDRKCIININNFILYDTYFLTEKKLYWFKKEQKKIWWSVFSYHNFRRKKGLPVRGQRTKTNASTCRKILNI